MGAKRRHRAAWLLLAGALCLTRSTTASALTNVGGVISADTSWTLAGSPYVAPTSILVANNATLSIEPGVEVRFAPKVALAIISGQLIARGTELSPIRFTADVSGTPTDADRWGYIGFSDGSVDAAFDGSGAYTTGSIIENAIVEYAGGTDYGGALRIIESAPYIHNADIRNNANKGLYVDAGNGLRFVGCNVSDNDNGGLYLEDSSDVHILDSHICNTGGVDADGIYMFSCDAPTISGCTVGNNVDNGLCLESVTGPRVVDNAIVGSRLGIDVYRVDYATISGNTLSENRLRGLYAHTCYAAIISENSLSENRGGGINLAYSDEASISDNLVSNNGSVVYQSPEYGGGIRVQASDGVTFSNNTIEGNWAAGHGAGVYLLDSNGVTFMGDRIRDNFGEGIFVRDSDGVILSTGGSPTWLFGNTDYDVFSDNGMMGSLEPDGPGNVDGRNVWWGTVDEAAIQAGIYDFFNDGSKGIVFYDPWAASDPAAPGDANLDCCVDGLDYVVWSDNYEPLVPGKIWVQADFTGDGIVDGLDYVVWSNSYLHGCPAAPGPVPEPTGLLLLALGACLPLRRRRR